MPIQANAADGTVLNFPDGTDPSVIEKTMKDHAQGKFDTQQEGRRGGSSEDFPDAMTARLQGNLGGSKNQALTYETPEGPTWREATNTLQELEKQGVPKTDPRYQKAIKDRALGFERLTSGSGSALAFGGKGASAAQKLAKGFDASKVPSIVEKLENKFPSVAKFTGKTAEQEAARHEGELKAEQQAKTLEAARAADVVKVQQKALDDEKARIQKNLGTTVQALNKDVDQGWKKIAALRAQRAVPEPSRPELKLPQIINPSLEAQVPGRVRQPNELPQQRVPGISGQLDQAIQTMRQTIGDHASRIYDMGATVAGDAPIDVTGLRQSVGDFIDALPPDVQNSVPPLLKEMRNNDASTMTLPELQQIRTTLRDFGENPKLTPDLKKGPYRLMAGKADALMHSPSNPAPVRAGVRIIDAGDNFYAAQMPQFRSAAMQKIVDDVRDKLPMNTAKVLDTIAQSGESATLQRIVDIGGPNAMRQLRNADFDRMLTEARRPGVQETGKELLGAQQGGQFSQGANTIDAKKLLKAVEDREKDGTLRTLWGKDAPDIAVFTRRLAAKEGAIDAKTLKPSSFKELLKNALDIEDRLKTLKGATEPSKLDAVRAASAKLAEARAKTHPDAEVESTKVIPEKEAAETPGLEKEFRDYASKIKTAPLDNVPSEVRSFVNAQNKAGLLSREKYERALTRLTEIEESYKRSKQAVADKAKMRAAVKRLNNGILYAIVVGAGAGGYSLYKILKELPGL